MSKIQVAVQCVTPGNARNICVNVRVWMYMYIYTNAHTYMYTCACAQICLQIHKLIYWKPLWMKMTCAVLVWVCCWSLLRYAVGLFDVNLTFVVGVYCDTLGCLDTLVCLEQACHLFWVKYSKCCRCKSGYVSSRTHSRPICCVSHLLQTRPSELHVASLCRNMFCRALLVELPVTDLVALLQTFNCLLQTLNCLLQTL